MGTKDRENAPMAPDVFAISSDYMDRRAALDPVWATSLGIPGHDGQMTDYSPDGVEARATEAVDRYRRRRDWQA